MVATKVNDKEKAYMKLLDRPEKLSCRKIAKICKRSPSTVLKVIRSSLMSTKSSNEKKCHLDRPQKLTDRQKRTIIRALYKLRKREGNFTVKRIMKEAGISPMEVSVRTVSRLLNKKGFFYLVARKKGLVTDLDRKKRLAFARRMKKAFPENLWTDYIAFYLDGVSFVHKTRPLDQATAPKGKIWRRKAEGLSPGCTAKGQKSGTGGNLVKLIVGISHNEGVVLCEKYDKMNGEFFASFIDKHFEEAFRRANKGQTRMWIQDGDPSQNSAKARQAMTRVNAELLHIPPRSPDLNPIENFFKRVMDTLHDDVIEMRIERENYEQFTERVKRTIMGIPLDAINTLINSMNRRIDAVIKSKGKRLKY